jgi:putative MATE family efflux protein
MGEEKIGKLIWMFSLPAVIAMMVTALYNVVDSIFVGNGVGPIGLTAVTVAMPVMIVMMAFGMLIGIGATALISIRLGEKKVDVAEKILGNAVTLIVIASVLLTAIIILFLDPILIKLGATPEILPYAKKYTSIIAWGGIFQYIGFGLNNIIRGEGNPKLAMTTMIVSAVLNTILNPIFIFYFKLGISGSALATIISQAVSAIWILEYFVNKKSLVRLHAPNLKLDKQIVSGIFSIGLSPFLMQIAASVVVVMFNNSLLRYGGGIAVAAMGVINRVMLLILMPVFGINQGVQPIIGYNYGAKNYGRVKEALKKAIIYATAITTFGFIVIQVFDVYIIRIFNNNEQLVNLGSTGLKIFLFLLPLDGFQIVSANYFQAIGKPIYSIFLSLSRQVILLIPLIFILPLVWGLNGIWFAGLFSDFGSALLTGILLWVEVKKLREMHSISLQEESPALE